MSVSECDASQKMQPMKRTEKTPSRMSSKERKHKRQGECGRLINDDVMCGGYMPVKTRKKGLRVVGNR